MGFPVCVACSPWRHSQESVASRDSAFVQKKVKPEENEVGHTSLKSPTTNHRGVGGLKLSNDGRKGRATMSLSLIWMSRL